MPEMDQLDTQVSDLRFLAESPNHIATTAATPQSNSGISPRPNLRLAHSPASPLGDNSAQAQRQQAFSPAGDAASTSAGKRRSDDADDSGPRQQRSKRNRYISIACNECKRRKIKCNGETPCKRCGNLNLACLYTPNCCANNFRESEEYKCMSDNVSRLQEQINSLTQDMSALRQETLRLAPIQDRILPPSSASMRVSPVSSTSLAGRQYLPAIASRETPASFQGPTSMNFHLGVAKSTLHTMGYSGLGDSAEESGPFEDVSPQMTPTIQLAVDPSSPRPPRDPLWEFDKDEIIRLLTVYEEEVGIMYPLFNIEAAIRHAKALTAWMDAAKRNGLVPDFGQKGGINDTKSLNIKLLMCNALVVSEHGNSPRAARLFESLEGIMNSYMGSQPADISHIPLLALVASYRYFTNDDVLAWRVVGQVVHLCQELGLHRREGLSMIADPDDRSQALTTFWTAYVLNRRWAFAVGLPFVIDDESIDPELPLPDHYPYLVAMVTYTRLCAKIWKMADYFEPAVVHELKREDFESLDREILDWYKTVPEEVRLSDGQGIHDIPLPSTNTQRLQVWTRLRVNQARMWLFTPILHSASSIVANMPLALKVVELAKENVRYLNRLNNTTNLYRRIQVFYHQFMCTAIAVLFLASTHAPLQFSEICKDEFYMALDLVKGLSAKSSVSQRLWRTVRSLKALAPRLGLREYERSSAASSFHPLGTGVSPSQRHLSPPTTGHSAVTLMPSYERRPGGPNQGPYVPLSTRGSSYQSTEQPQHPPSHDQQQPTTEDQNNGVRLQTEMTRIFEGYMDMGMNGNMPYGHGRDLRGMTESPFSSSRGVVDVLDDATFGGQHGGVYQQLREII